MTKKRIRSFLTIFPFYTADYGQADSALSYELGQSLVLTSWDQFAKARRWPNQAAPRRQPVRPQLDLIAAFPALCRTPITDNRGDFDDCPNSPC